MIKISLIALSVFLSLSSSSLSYISAPRSLEQLYKVADYVAVVCVESGETLIADDARCGVKYKARILDGIKGVRVGEMLEFGPYHGLKIGNAYLVLLSKSDHYEPLMFSGFCCNSCFKPQVQETEQKCISMRLKGNWVIHGGLAAMEVVSDTFKGHEQVIIPKPYISLPRSIKTEPIQKSGGDSWSKDQVLVKLADLVSYLRQLGR